MSLARVVVLVVVVVTALSAGVALLRAVARPSNVRPWIEEQSVLPAVEREGDRVTVTGVRAFRWRSATDYEARWETRTYDLSALRRVWFGLSPFGGRWRGPAHAFLSFEFGDGEYVAISVEARREEGERYGVLAGLLNRFEVMYVIGEERDVIGLRTHVWGDPVHMYPVATSPEKGREVFLAMVSRAEALRERPEFYNTFAHNCTTALLSAANAARVEPIPFGLDVVLPGYADRRLLRLGLLDTELPLEEARAAFLVNGRALAAPLEEAGFSERIRGLAGGE
jgi:hypothetical protein